jgi:hypothetical protein
MSKKNDYREDAEFNGGPRPALEPDPARYRAALAEFDLTEAQETELLQTLWSIMHTFVEMGFTVDVCGQLFGEFNDVSGSETDNGKIAHSN